MSTDKDKTEAGGADRPVLFGPSNDPKLASMIEALTGPKLDRVIDRIESHAGDFFGSDDDEDPFPNGIPDDVQATTSVIDEAAEDTGEESEDGLDLMLDRLSDPVETDGVAPALPAENGDEIRSLKDLEQIQDSQTPAAAPQRSPIADVLVRSSEPFDDADDTGYRDTGLPGTGQDDASEETAEQPAYDPLEDVDIYAEYDEEHSDGEDIGHDPDFPDPDFPDPDFPDDEFDDLDALEASDHDADDVLFPDEDEDVSSQGTDASHSYALPEPSPYGDQGMMGGFYEDDEEMTRSDLEAAEKLETPLDETDDAELDDWALPDERAEDQADDQAEGVAPEVTTEREEEAPEEAFDGSALDDLITGLSGAADPRPADRSEDEAEDVSTTEPEQALSGSVRIPSFLRRDGTGRPPLSAYSDKPVQESGTDRNEEGPVMHEESAETEAETEADVVPEPEQDELQQEAAPSGKGRKKLLAGVAALALLAAVGAGAYLMMPGLSGPTRVAEAPGTVLAPAMPEQPGADVSANSLPGVTPEQQAPVSVVEEEGGSGLVPPVFETAEAPSAPAATEGQGGSGLVPPVFEAGETASAPADAPFTDPVLLGQAPGSVEPVEPVPAEVSDLLAELNRDVVAPAPVGVAPEVVSALEERVRAMEDIRETFAEREAELTNEITGLTDQITGLLQRDSDQAERLERMERLIRGQSAILAQFGQMEESLEQTQVVLLDVSARIGSVEGKNPADRDAVNRALADIEDRIQALTANMSILARMSIEGVDALRAPNASSGTAAVQTAPSPQQANGGSDTVFRSETGGFRISSDPAGRVPADVEKDDFIEGYGYVLDVLPASDGQRLVIMENGSVLVPASQ